MKRPLLVILLAAVVGLGGIVAWTAVSRDREYRRLIAAGDAALAGDQAFQAIEAFSGAIALNHDSMLAYLRRGETYRRLGDLKAALRDLPTVSAASVSVQLPATLAVHLEAVRGRQNVDDDEGRQPGPQ